MADINLEEFKITDAEVDVVKLEGTENPLRSESAAVGQARFDAFPKMICVKFNAFVEKIVQAINNLFSEAKDYAHETTNKMVGKCVSLSPISIKSTTADHVVWWRFGDQYSADDYSIGIEGDKIGFFKICKNCDVINTNSKGTLGLDSDRIAENAELHFDASILNTSDLVIDAIESKIYKLVSNWRVEEIQIDNSDGEFQISPNFFKVLSYVSYVGLYVDSTALENSEALLKCEFGVIGSASSGIKSSSSMVFQRAKAYADEKDAEVLASAEEHANSVAQTAESNAKAYAGGKDGEVLGSAKEYADSTAETAESNAKAYTDEILKNGTLGVLMPLCEPLGEDFMLESNSFNKNYSANMMKNSGYTEEYNRLVVSKKSVPEISSDWIGYTIMLHHVSETVGYTIRDVKQRSDGDWNIDFDKGSSHWEGYSIDNIREYWNGGFTIAGIPLGKDYILECKTFNKNYSANMMKNSGYTEEYNRLVVSKKSVPEISSDWIGYTIMLHHVSETVGYTIRDVKQRFDGDWNIDFDKGSSHWEGYSIDNIREYWNGGFTIVHIKYNWISKVDSFKTAVDEAQTYTNSVAKTVEENAKAYADEKDAETLGSAKNYTDEQVAASRTLLDGFDITIPLVEDETRKIALPSNDIYSYDSLRVHAGSRGNSNTTELYLRATNGKNINTSAYSGGEVFGTVPAGTLAYISESVHNSIRITTNKAILEKKVYFAEFPPSDKIPSGVSARDYGLVEGSVVGETGLYKYDLPDLPPIITETACLHYPADDSLNYGAPVVEIDPGTTPPLDVADCGSFVDVESGILYIRRKLNATIFEYWGFFLAELQEPVEVEFDVYGYVEYEDGSYADDLTNHLPLIFTLMTSPNARYITTRGCECELLYKPTVKYYVDHKLSDISTAVEEAKTHADEKDAEVLKNAKEYADSVASKAESNAKGYTDNKISSILKGSASGEVVAVDDISPVSKEINVALESKNLYYNTKAINTAFNGITATGIEGESEIILNGTATSVAGREVMRISLGAGTYTFSVFGMNDTDKINLQNAETGNVSGTFTVTTHKTLTFDTEVELKFVFVIASGNSYENKPIQLQIEKGSVATAFTPYSYYVTDAGVKVYGKNLLDVSNPYGETTGSKTTVTGDTVTLVKGATGYAPSVIWEIDDIKKFVGKKLTLSFKLDGFGGSADNNSFSVTIHNGNTRYESVSLISNNAFTTSSIGSLITQTVEIPQQEEYKTLCIRLYMNNGKVEGDYITVSNVQLEVNDTATKYEPFIEPVLYSSDELNENDYKIEGFYPNTTLMVDTVGVAMDIEYGRDLNKAFEELTQAVISLGGNV